MDSEDDDDYEPVGNEDESLVGVKKRSAADRSPTTTRKATPISKKVKNVVEYTEDQWKMLNKVAENSKLLDQIPCPKCELKGGLMKNGFV